MPIEFSILCFQLEDNLWYYASRMSKRGVQGPKPMLECATVVNPFSGMSGNMQPIISKETS